MNPPNTFTELIDSTLNFLFTSGKYFGQHLSQFQFKNRILTRLVQCLLFAFVFFSTLIGSVLIVFSILPFRGEKFSSIVQFDTFTVFKTIWIFRGIDCAGCFVINNYAYRFLSRKGFFDRCKQYNGPDRLSAKWTPEKRLKRWRCVTKVAPILILIYVVTEVVCSSVILGQRYVDPNLMKVDRVARWLSISEGLVLACMVLNEVVCLIHGSYHGIFYWSLCDLVTIHFRTLSAGLKSEMGGSFSTVLVQKYHVEYARLAEMVRLLDRAFSFSCLLQLLVVIIGVCETLYLLCTGTSEAIEIFILAFLTFTMICLFTGIVVPAIILQQQAERPKRLLHRWFIKYQQACFERKQELDQIAIQSYSAFMQYLNSASVGITIGSLAKLDMSVLLSVVSVILTYFLVIYQFNDSPKCECHFHNGTTAI